MHAQRIPSVPTLIGGDVLTLAVVTVTGFATHAEAGAVLRMFTTFLPLVAAWLVVAPWLGQFRLEESSLLKNILRTALAAVIAAPLATFLRGLWLNAPILPIFVLVMAATSALALCLWRGIYLLLLQRRVVAHG